MSGITAHPAGTFCWPELATTDLDAAVRFYTALFAWTTEELVDERGSYTIFRLNGLDVGGAYEIEGPAADRPTQWHSYISVASADAAAAQARALGGRQVSAPADVSNAGRVAVLADPGGASFRVWEARTHIGAQVLDVPGALCWTELVTPDLGAAEGFYTKLFGWKTERDHPTLASYVEVVRAGTPLAGMLRSAPGRSHASTWMPYFAVSDVDDTLSVARRHFGKLLVPPTDLPRIGRYAVLRDPLGARFGVFGVNEAA